MKNWLIIIGLLSCIVGGVGYSIFMSPDLSPQLLFKSILKEFSKQAKPLERELRVSNQLKENQQQLQFDFAPPNQQSESVKVTMVVSANRVELLVHDSDSALSGQTIELQPVMTDNEVVWKCINGTALVRIRTKNCRLGLGETSDNMAKL